MDWTASGIENRFSYVAVGNTDLDAEYAVLDSVAGGTITEEMDSDYFGSLSLDYDGEAPSPHLMVRVYHTASLDGETETEELGTFMYDGVSKSNAYRRVSGSATYYSPLIRLGTDLRCGDAAVAKGTVVADKFESVVEGAHGVCAIGDGLSSKTLGSAHTWEHGESCLDECVRLADAAGAVVGVDPHGRITLELEQPAASRAPSFSLLYGQAGGLAEGVSIEDPEMVNAVVASHEVDGVFYTAKAVLDEEEDWSFQSIGRHITEDVSLSDVDSDATASEVKSLLSEAVEEELAAATSAGRTFSGTMPYQPIGVGEVGTLTLETEDGAEEVAVQLTAREISLDASMLMDVTFREVI